MREIERGEQRRRVANICAITKRDCKTPMNFEEGVARIHAFKQGL